MKTITINLYSFNELSEAGKQKAIESCALFNVDYKWFESTFEDAKEIGLKIEEFELDKGLWAKGEFIKSGSEVADLIISNHGEDCETFKTAKTFLGEWDALVEKYSDGINKNVVTEENEYNFDNKADELEQEFKSSLLSDYAKMLQDDYEYQTSEAAIIETIEANEYTFEADGTLNNG